MAPTAPRPLTTRLLATGVHKSIQKTRLDTIKAAAAKAKQALEALKCPTPLPVSNMENLIMTGSLNILYNLFKKVRELSDLRSVVHYTKHVCSQCTTETGTQCDCGRTQCSVCAGTCILCTSTQKTLPMSTSSEIECTNTVRKILLQSYVLQKGALPNANKVLKSKYARLMAELHLCFKKLKSLGVSF